MFNNEEKSQAEPAVSSPQNLATTDVNRRTPFNLYAHYFEDEGGWRYVGLWDNRKLFNEGQCEAHLHATADEACECFLII